MQPEYLWFYVHGWSTSPVLKQETWLRLFSQLSHVETSLSFLPLNMDSMGYETQPTLPAFQPLCQRGTEQDLTLQTPILQLLWSLFFFFIFERLKQWLKWLTDSRVSGRMSNVPSCSLPDAEQGVLTLPAPGCQSHGGDKVQSLQFSGLTHCLQGMTRSEGKFPNALLQSGHLLQRLPRPMPWLPEETLELLTHGYGTRAAFWPVNFPCYSCCNHFPSFQLFQLLLKEHKELATIGDNYLLSNSNNNSTFSAMVRGKKPNKTT